MRPFEKDECSSSSSSSASQKSPRSSLQLTRTQSNPSEISCFTNPLLDRELDPARNAALTGADLVQIHSSLKMNHPWKPKYMLIGHPTHH